MAECDAEGKAPDPQYLHGIRPLSRHVGVAAALFQDDLTHPVNLIPVFLTGLLGSVHCIGMCGGIVGAFSAASPSRRAFPIAVAVQGSQAVASAPALDSAIFT